MVYKKKNVLRRQALQQKMISVDYKVNKDIVAEMVRVVGDNVGNKICSRDEAISLAESMDLDLVEVSPKSSPPVCKILDFEKFKYDQLKFQKKRQAHSVKSEMKEIKVGPNIGENDLNFKMRYAINFLRNKSVVKVSVFFPGRYINFKEKGEDVLKKFIEQLSSFGAPEAEPHLEGKKMYVTILPK